MLWLLVVVIVLLLLFGGGGYRYRDRYGRSYTGGVSLLGLLVLALLVLFLAGVIR
jgi:hypothetical protein